jgi:hypothetical protein
MHLYWLYVTFFLRGSCEVFVFYARRENNGLGAYTTECGSEVYLGPSAPTGVYCDTSRAEYKDKNARYDE